MSEYEKYCEQCDEKFISYVETVCDKCHEEHEDDIDSRFKNLQSQLTQANAKLAMARDALSKIEDEILIERKVRNIESLPTLGMLKVSSALAALDDEWEVKSGVVAYDAHMCEYIFYEDLDGTNYHDAKPAKLLIKKEK